MTIIIFSTFTVREGYLSANSALRGKYEEDFAVYVSVVFECNRIICTKL